MMNTSTSQAEMEEPHVWGRLTKHDAVIFQDPDFEVFIDPDGDRQNYYEFEMNALNTGWDLILKKAYIDGGPALNEWEIPGLKTAVSVNGTFDQPNDTDRGWSVEMAFPWKALGEFSKQKAPPNEGDVWRVDFSRVRMANRNPRRKIHEGSRDQGRQLGVVANRDHRHASTGELGICEIHEKRFQTNLPTQAQWGCRQTAHRLLRRESISRKKQTLGTFSRRAQHCVVRSEASNK
jgi:hypothetical protein